MGRALRRSDLDKLLELIDVVPSNLRAADQLGLSNDRLGTVLRAFYASLFSTVTAQFERLQDPTLRELMRNNIADKVAVAHAKVSFSVCVCNVDPFDSRIFFVRVFKIYNVSFVV